MSEVRTSKEWLAMDWEERLKAKVADALNVVPSVRTAPSSSRLEAGDARPTEERLATYDLRVHEFIRLLIESAPFFKPAQGFPEDGVACLLAVYLPNPVLEAMSRNYRQSIDWEASRWYLVEGFNLNSSPAQLAGAMTYFVKHYSPEGANYQIDRVYREIDNFLTFFTNDIRYKFLSLSSLYLKERKEKREVLEDLHGDSPDSESDYVHFRGDDESSVVKAPAETPTPVESDDAQKESYARPADAPRTTAKSDSAEFRDPREHAKMLVQEWEESGLSTYQVYWLAKKKMRGARLATEAVYAKLTFRDVINIRGRWELVGATITLLAMLDLIVATITRQPIAFILAARAEAASESSTRHVFPPLGLSPLSWEIMVLVFFAYLMAVLSAFLWKGYFAKDKSEIAADAVKSIIAIGMGLFFGRTIG